MTSPAAQRRGVAGAEVAGTRSTVSSVTGPLQMVELMVQTAMIDICPMSAQCPLICGQTLRPSRYLLTCPARPGTRRGLAEGELTAEIVPRGNKPVPGWQPQSRAGTATPAPAPANQLPPGDAAARPARPQVGAARRQAGS